jgi:hypothetical protein
MDFQELQEGGRQYVQWGVLRGSDPTRMSCLPSPLWRYKLYAS